MTQQTRLRRMGWLAVLSLCTVFYLALHLKVHAVQSEVVPTWTSTARAARVRTGARLRTAT